jgi:hypothetical protein
MNQKVHVEKLPQGASKKLATEFMANCMATPGAELNFMDNGAVTCERPKTPSGPTKTTQATQAPPGR